MSDAPASMRARLLSVTWLLQLRESVARHDDEERCGSEERASLAHVALVGARTSPPPRILSAIVVAQKLLVL